METIRLLSCTFKNDAVEFICLAENGTERSFRLPMPDFIIAQRKIQEQIINLFGNEPKPRNPDSVQPMSVVHPSSLAIQQDALAGDPILVLGLRALGYFPVQVPRSGVPALIAALAPYASQETPPSAAN